VSKIRQPRLPDGPVWVRTFPVTFLHDHVSERHRHDWHQLTYAVRGHLEVVTDDARRIVPADRAVWVPAGVDHVELMRAPVSMRSIYVAPAALRKKPGGCRTIAVTPLLRELLLHVSRIGALDRREAEQARLAAVVLDLLATAEDVPLELRSPRDPRARRFAELVAAEPGTDTPLPELARAAGSSLRTLERCFLAETGLTIGAWRRRVRLFHAVRLLDAGRPVTEVALDVGYSTTSAFSAAFARELGRSPTGRRTVTA